MVLRPAGTLRPVPAAVVLRRRLVVAAQLARKGRRPVRAGLAAAGGPAALGRHHVDVEQLGAGVGLEYREGRGDYFDNTGIGQKGNRSRTTKAVTATRSTQFVRPQNSVLKTCVKAKQLNRYGSSNATLHCRVVKPPQFYGPPTKWRGKIFCLSLFFSSIVGRGLQKEVKGI